MEKQFVADKTQQINGLLQRVVEQIEGFARTREAGTPDAGVLDDAVGRLKEARRCVDAIDDRLKGDTPATRDCRACGRSIRRDAVWLPLDETMRRGAPRSPRRLTRPPRGRREDPREPAAPEHHENLVHAPQRSPLAVHSRPS